LVEAFERRRVGREDGDLDGAIPDRGVERQGFVEGNAGHAVVAAGELHRVGFSFRRDGDRGRGDRDRGPEMEHPWVLHFGTSIPITSSSIPITSIALFVLLVERAISARIARRLSASRT